MSKKIRVGIVFGGKSAEHEVSLLSAKSVIESLDQQKYEIVLIGIDKRGEWHVHGPARYVNHADNPKQVALAEKQDAIALIPRDNGKHLVSLSRQGVAEPIDVIFPILHGTYGEDGTVQGLLKLIDVPFVGAGVLGSAVGMDKDVMKRLLREAKIPVAKFITVHRHEAAQLSFDRVVKELGLPFFIKPANLGSSIGITKVKTKDDFDPAVRFAFDYDRKILIEEFIDGRELECSVLGNEHPEASLPAEIIPQLDFYSFDAKYLDDAKTEFKFPAPVSKAKTQAVQKLAIKVFRVLCCEGMARVDFFMKKNGKLIVNEINTIPGFTKLSVYPKLWAISGLSYSQLVDRLIELAIDRHKKEKELKTS